MYRLMIVDDEEIEREGLAEIIRWEDYGVELADTAWNGADALAKLQEQKFDIVFTDIKMPGMNGIELIRRAKEQFSDIVFVVLSGYGEYEYTSQAMSEGVRHYLLKPIDASAIIDVLKKVIGEIKDKNEADMLYSQIQEMLKGDGAQKVSLVESMVDIDALRASTDIGEILFEVYALYLKAQTKGYTPARGLELSVWTLRLMGIRDNLDATTSDWELVKATTKAIARRQGINAEVIPQDLPTQMLYAIYEHIGDSDLSLKFISNEILYMNEDYIGRVFLKHFGQKFSAYVLSIRVRLCAELFKFDSSLKIGMVAQMLGFASDGQYFSKSFKKVMGCTPTQYRERLLSR